MKKFLILLLTLCATITLLACFNSDPSSLLQNSPRTVNLGNGGRVDIFASKWTEQYDDTVAMIEAAFPLTLNLSFTGFVDENGDADTDIIQITLYYYDKTAGWLVLKDVKSPRHTVVGDSARAIFGRHTITGPLGYNKGEYIPIVLYFKSRSGAEAFNLATFLSNRRNRNAPGSVEGASVIGLKITGNSIAY